MILFSFLACFDDSARLNALDEARARWEEQGLLNYRYTLDERCFCPDGPVTVEVEDGIVVSVTGEFEASYEGLTMPELFDEVEEAITSQPDGFEVRYDGAIGYPVELDVDPMSNAMDEEFGFEITAFEAL